MMLTGLLLVVIGLANAGESPTDSPTDSRLDILENRIDVLEDEKDSLSERISNIEKHYPKDGECEGGFICAGKCFTVVIIGAGAMNYYDAKRHCTYDGMSTCGNIYTLECFNKLKEHVQKRKEETRLNFINPWTCMTRDIPGGQIRLSNGAIADYQGQGNHRNKNEWRTDEARRTNVYVSIWTDGLTHFTNPGGYGNVWPTFNWNAALCERPLTW